MTIQNFRLTGRDADLNVTGTASTEGQRALSLRVDGNLNLEILEAFSSEIYSSGAITLNAAINGTAANPDVIGKLQLEKASFNMLEMPNGISNATGTVAFNGSDAYIQNITGESGGGKVTLAGTWPMAARRCSSAPKRRRPASTYPTRIRITTQVDANLTLNGTSDSSLVTGTVGMQSTFRCIRAPTSATYSPRPRAALGPHRQRRRAGGHAV